YWAALSPDGTQLATGGHAVDRGWDVATGRELLGSKGTPPPSGAWPSAPTENGWALRAGTGPQGFGIRQPARKNGPSKALGGRGTRGLFGLQSRRGPDRRGRPSPHG